MLTTVLIWVLAILLIAAGVAGLVLPALPGPLMVFLGLVAAAWAEDFAFVGWGTLTGIGIMAVLSMLLDFIAGAFGARRYGASGRAVIGAALGAVVGVFFGLVGVILGPFVGAMIGELSIGRKLHEISRAGVGATIGLLLGVAAKLALGIAMIGTFVLMRFI